MSLPNPKDEKQQDPFKPIDPDELMHDEEGLPATSADDPEDLVRAYPPTVEPTGMEDPDDLMHEEQEIDPEP